MSAIVTHGCRWREGRAVKALAVLAVVGLGLLNAQAAMARGIPAAGAAASACNVTAAAGWRCARSRAFPA